MIRSRPFAIAVSASSLLTAILTAPGCVTEEVSRTPGRFILPETPEAGGDATAVSDLGARFGWRSLGSIDYDDFSVPLVSPDGRHMVVRGGAPPRWDAVLATKDAEVPPASTFRIVAIEDDGLRIVHELQEPWLLGRGRDDEGFLVEELLTGAVGWTGD